MPSPLQGFQPGFGASLAGPNPLGVMIKSLLQRANDTSLLRAKAGYEAEAEVAKEQALGPFKVQQARETALAQAEGLKTFLSGSGGQGPGGEVTGIDFAPAGPTVHTTFPAKGKIEAEAAAQASFSRGQAERQERVLSSAGAAAENLKRWKSSLDKTEAPTPGLSRPFQAIGLGLKRIGQTPGTGQNLEITEAEIESQLGLFVNLLGRETASRLSDQDVRRQLRRLRVGGDVPAVRAGKYLGVVDAANAEVRAAGVGKDSLINPLSVNITPQEFIEARRAAGYTEEEITQELQEWLDDLGGP